MDPGHTVGGHILARIMRQSAFICSKFSENNEKQGVWNGNQLWKYFRFAALKTVHNGMDCVRQPTSPTRFEISPNPLASGHCLVWSQPFRIENFERWVNTFWVCNHFKTENGQNRQTVVVPFLLGLRNTYLTVNSLSYFSNIVKVFWISFHILCSFSKFRGFGRFSFFVFATLILVHLCSYWHVDLQKSF